MRESSQANREYPSRVAEGSSPAVVLGHAQEHEVHAGDCDQEGHHRAPSDPAGLEEDRPAEGADVLHTALIGYC